MSTYVIGEIAALLAITALAGILIGWCIKGLFAGRGVRVVREQVARSVDDAAADVRQLQGTLKQKDSQLRDATLELQQLRGRDVSLKAGNSTQIEEINKLKSELATSRQTLERNRVEFNDFRNEKQTEMEALSSRLSSFQAGGPVHDERIKESSETISALRTAIRENDKVIDSLRARVKEGDSSVENLRNQLKNAESSAEQLQVSMQTNSTATSQLSAELQEVSTQRDKYKRDYDQVLENKNSDIQKLQARLEELGSVKTLLQQKEHDYNKLSHEKRDIAARGSAQITDLKRTISEGTTAQAQAQKELKTLRQQVQTLEQENQTRITQTQLEATDARGKLSAATRELEKKRDLQTQLDTKAAEVVALNDMLRDVSTKRDKLQTRVTDLDKQLGAVKADAAATIEAQRRIAALSNTIKERDTSIAKLRTDMDDVVARRNSLGLELGEMQANSVKAEQDSIKQSQAELAKANQKVTALNDMVRDVSTARDKLQTRVTDLDKKLGTAQSDAAANIEAQSRITALSNTIKERDTSIAKLRTDMDDVVAQRNSLGVELGEIRASNEKSEQEIVKKAQNELASANQIMKERDQNIEKLRTDMKNIVNSRDQLNREVESLKAKGVELESFKSSMQETVAQREAEVNQRKVAYEKLQHEFAQIAKTRDEYELRLNTLRTQIDAQAQSSEKEITQLKTQIAELRSKLSLADSEKQRLSEEISKSEGLRLTVTERDAELKRLQIQLQESSDAGPLRAALTEQQNKSATLTSALQERDAEISRLSSVVTDNRLSSKNVQSENSLLQQEIDSQGKLIRSLEEQAENTLTLHKKIATQSTEIEDLRAQLYQQNDSSPPVQAAMTTPDSSELRSLQSQLQSQKDESLMLQQQLDQSNQRIAISEKETSSRATELQARNEALETELRKIQSDLQRAGPGNTRSDRQVRTSSVDTSATANNSATKPRVFVRQDSTADLVAGTSTAAPEAPASTKSGSLKTGRALYTRDGYKLKLPDGSDDLTLLPGIEPTAAQALKRNGVADFEQITLWTRREVVHYADRCGIPAGKAESYDWPNVARLIIQGSYRKTGKTAHAEPDHSNA